MDIRCPNAKHGEITEKGSGILEVRCRSHLCRNQPGEIVIHRWNLAKINEDKTVELTTTIRLKDPMKGKPK